MSEHEGAPTPRARGVGAQQEPTPYGGSLQRQVPPAGEMLFVATLGGLAAAALIIGWDYPVRSRTWPLLVAGFLLLLSVAWVIQAVWRSGVLRRSRPAWQQTAANGGPPAADGVDDQPETDVSLRPILLAGLSFGLFVLAAKYVGFFAATAVYLPAFLFLSGYRHPLRVAMITIGSLIVLYFMFGQLLNIPLFREL